MITINLFLMLEILCFLVYVAYKAYPFPEPKYNFERFAYSLINAMVDVAFIGLVLILFEVI